MAAVLWQDGVVEQLGGLGRWVEGRFIPTPAPADEVVAAERFLDRDFLRAAIQRASSLVIGRPAGSPTGADTGDETGDEIDLDLRIGVSRFVRHYSASVTAVAMAGLGRGVGIDLSLTRSSFVYRHDLPFCVTLDAVDTDVLRCRERPTRWHAAGPVVDTVEDLRRFVWRQLYAGHLGLVFARLLELVNISPKLLWTNAAEWVGIVSDAAEEYLGGERAAVFVADRRALLGAPHVPGLPGVNPLRDRLDWVPVDGAQPHRSAVQTRRMCCLTYFLADRRGRLCENCPYLPLDDRIALINERHGQPMAAGHQTAGPAVQRAIERGLAKINRE
jgi:hypothetical protein